jgi:hypothetical protein
MHTSVIIEEKILNLKTDVIAALEEIHMETRNGIYIEVPVKISNTQLCAL